MTNLQGMMVICPQCGKQFELEDNCSFYGAGWEITELDIDCPYCHASYYV